MPSHMCRPIRKENSPRPTIWGTVVIMSPPTPPPPLTFQWTDGPPPVQIQAPNGPTTSLAGLLWGTLLLLLLPPPSPCDTSLANPIECLNPTLVDGCGCEDLSRCSERIWWAYTGVATTATSLAVVVERFTIIGPLWGVVVLPGWRRIERVMEVVTKPNNGFFTSDSGNPLLKARFCLLWIKNRVNGEPVKYNLLMLFWHILTRYETFVVMLGSYWGCSW